MAGDQSQAAESKFSVPSCIIIFSDSFVKWLKMHCNNSLKYWLPQAYIAGKHVIPK